MNYVTSKEMTDCGLLPVQGGNSLLSLTLSYIFLYLDTLKLATRSLVTLKSFERLDKISCYEHD